MMPEDRELLAQALEAAARALREPRRERVTINPAPGLVEQTRSADRRLLLRVSEAADLLGLSRTMIYALIGSGELPSLLIGSSRRIPRAQLVEWVNQTFAEQHED